MKCEVLLRNLGLEAREIEPQPCGAEALYLAYIDTYPRVYHYACVDHVGLLITPGVRWVVFRELTR